MSPRYFGLASIQPFDPSMFVLRASQLPPAVVTSLATVHPWGSALALAPGAAKPSASSFSIARFLAFAQGTLHYVARHTGLPIVLVAAIALVVSWSFVRKSARFVVEVALALALLLIATGLGWISW